MVEFHTPIISRLRTSSRPCSPERAVYTYPDIFETIYFFMRLRPFLYKLNLKTKTQFMLTVSRYT